MTTGAYDKPIVSATYVQLTLQLAAERGVSKDAMLAGLDLDPRSLDDPDTRIGLLLYGRLCLRAMRLGNDASLGYEFGLRNHVTTHGFVGFGAMSQATVRDAIDFLIRYQSLRMPGWDLRLEVDREDAILEAREAAPFGALRQYALDMMMVGIGTSLRAFGIEPEIRFDCAQPDYFERYRDRLPRTRFDAGANQAVFPASALGRNLTTANTVTARLVERECERELVLLGSTENTPARVRAVLAQSSGRYPDLGDVAKTLAMSERSLKRHLSRHGLSFRDLLDEARRRDAVRLLDDPHLTLEDVAETLGFGSSKSFSRAFLRWTGTTPGRFRSRARSR